MKISQRTLSSSSSSSSTLTSSSSSSSSTSLWILTALSAAVAVMPGFTLGAQDYQHSHQKMRAHENVFDSNSNDINGPRFAEPIPNVTVSVGSDALLTCIVDGLKGFKVAWVRVDTQTILSIHHSVITQNTRVTLTYNDHRSFYLHIREVDESDRGWYMCQVNTDPMRSIRGYLQVVVPPVILDSVTSSDMVVREGTNVTLTCKAGGYPEPYVMWRREDGNEIVVNGESVNVLDGEILSITKISRLNMAAYLCVASNGVPPSISKRVQLKVQFPPMLSIPNQLEGAYLGQDVILECHTEAYPQSINYWTMERGDMIITGEKYEIILSSNVGYSKYMKLKIRNISRDDFGSYRCVAKNSLGETDGVIKLDEIPRPTTVAVTEPTFTGGRGKARRPYPKHIDPNNGADGDHNDYSIDVVISSSSPSTRRHPPGVYHNGCSSQHNQQHFIIKIRTYLLLPVVLCYHINYYFTLR